MLQRTMRGKPLVYLDSAATAHKPTSVIEAVTSFYRDGYGTVLRGVYELAEQANDAYQAAREKTRRFLGAAKSEEIIFCRGTTDAINMIAYSFGKAYVRAGDTILISAMEHHSNLVPWQVLCEERGATLRVIPIDERGELCLDSYQTMLDTYHPKLVAVTHVSNVLGTVNPIRELACAAHAAGAKILVDGAQAVPHLSVNVQELDVDFYAFSGH
jgi:cysteine desulfurase/selenocysteine lyase